MTDPRGPQNRRPAGSSDRDRGLARVAKTTVAGGAGAVVATAALAVWLSQPAHAKPGSTATKSGTSSGSSGSSSGSSSGGATRRQPDSNDGGLQLPDAPPGGASGDSSQQQPPVSSGGS
jgi:hypothetical protein